MIAKIDFKGAIKSLQGLLELSGDPPRRDQGDDRLRLERFRNMIDFLKGA